MDPTVLCIKIKADLSTTVPVRFPEYLFFPEKTVPTGYSNIKDGDDEDDEGGDERSRGRVPQQRQGSHQAEQGRAQLEVREPSQGAIELI